MKNLGTEVLALIALVIIVAATVALSMAHISVPSWFGEIAAGLVGGALGVSVPKSAAPRGLP